MSTLLLVQLLFFALALVMGGLGLSLRMDDFRRLRSQGRGVATALIVQMVVLPLVALSLVVVLRLSPQLAVGLMLLAATPGSISTNLYSHLFGGNVAFNVSLTGANTLLCAFSLPLVCGWALALFSGTDQPIPLLFDKALQTIAVVFVPVLLGMLVASKLPRLAKAVNKPVKVASALVVVVFSLAAIAKEWEALRSGFRDVGLSILIFNALSLAIGYGAARLAALDRAQTITIAFQVSIHNALLAIYVAMVVLNDSAIALPAAVYSITMNLFGIGFGAWVKAAGKDRQAERELGIQSSV